MGNFTTQCDFIEMLPIITAAHISRETLMIKYNYTFLYYI